MEEERHYQQAFGVHTGISEEVRDDINRIKNNSDDIEDLRLSSEDTENFTNLAWQLLGRYIANNTHLEGILVGDCGLTDEKIASLFSELVKSSVERLDIDGNEFGIEGVRSMIPFLSNSPLYTLFMSFSRNNNINSEWFEVLVLVH